MKKINKRTLKRVIQEEVASIQQEGIFDWFKKKEEPTTGETDEEFEAANAQARADQEARDAEEIEKVKEEILDKADSFGDYLPDVYDFLANGNCKEKTEDCDELSKDYSYGLWKFLILDATDALGRGDVRRVVVKYYEGHMKGRTLEGLQNLLSTLDRRLEKVIAQRNSTSMAAYREREKMLASQSQDGEWLERGNTGTYYQRGKGYHPGGNVAVRENKRLSKRKLQRIINEELQKLLGSRD